jgi:hypothetical protein
LHRPALRKAQRRSRVAIVLLSIVLPTMLVVALEPGVSTAAGTGSWVQYGHDAQRTSVDPDQATVTAVSPHWNKSVDAAVFAQPLVWNNHVFVATENNSVYSFNATTGIQEWQRSLGTPATNADLTINGVECSNLGPTVGITSTPVIDPATGRLYAVAQVRTPSLHYEFWTLNATTGQPIGVAQTIDPWLLVKTGPGDHTSLQTVFQQQRGALLLANNYVYVPFGGRVRGCGSWYGWMSAIPVAGQAAVTPFQIQALPKGGSIWSPAGASLGASGSVWVPTGNASCPTACQSTTHDLTESVIKFSPTLGVLDSFTPSNWVQLNDDDLDIGSFTTAHLGNNLAFQIGKSGVGYLLNENNLGHSYPNGAVGGEITSAQVCNVNNPFAHAAAAWVPPNLYVPCQERVKRLQINPAGSFTIAAMGRNNSYTGSTVYSGGVVWNVNPTFDTSGNVVSATLNSYNAQTLTDTFPPLTLQLATGMLLKPAHFASPASGNGHLYVASDGQISAFLLTAATPTPVPGTPTPTPVPTRTPTPVPGTTSVTLNPVADTYTARSAPNSTAGGASTTLRSDVVGTDTAFLRFDLASLAGKTINSATLRLHTSTESWAGSTVVHNIKFVFANDWQEQFMSFNNQVAPSAIASTPMATITGTAPNTWYPSSALTLSTVQSRAGSMLSMAIDAPAGDVLIFNSRESGMNTAPQLIVVYH